MHVLRMLLYEKVENNHFLRFILLLSLFLFYKSFWRSCQHQTISETEMRKESRLKRDVFFFV